MENPKAMSHSNTIHWLCDPLKELDIMVLRRIQEGTQGYHCNLFNVAYLIARECVEADTDVEQLRITAKGLDALDYFASS